MSLQTPIIRSLIPSLRSVTTRPVTSRYLSPISSLFPSTPSSSSSSSSTPSSLSFLSSRPYSTASETQASEASTTEGGSSSSSDAAQANGEADKKIAELEAKIKELNKEMQYMRADYQTLTRRSSEEKIKASDFAISSFARSLLSTADTLTTALQHVPKPLEPNSALANLAEGVQLTHRALIKTLEQHGVTSFSPIDEQFDPNLHEATFQIPSEVAPPRKDGKQRGKGEVFEVGKEGWMIKGRVLRPAQVGITHME